VKLSANVLLNLLAGGGSIRSDEQSEEEELRLA
jgi:hypothetical protein